MLNRVIFKKVIYLYSEWREIQGPPLMNEQKKKKRHGQWRRRGGGTKLTTWPGEGIPYSLTPRHSRRREKREKKSMKHSSESDSTHPGQKQLWAHSQTKFRSRKVKPLKKIFKKIRAQRTIKKNMNK